MEADDGTTCIDKIMRKIDWKILKDIKLPIGKNKYLKRLDWYIIKKFLGTYVFAIALIISIAVVFDFNEKMDRFMSHEAPWEAIIFDYYMNFIPYFANLFSPLFVFIAVIFFTSKLAENSEIIAMFSTGMSFKRMLRPYMVSAAIIAVTTFCLGSYVIPKGSVTRLNFEDKYYKPRKSTTARNIQLEVDSGVIAYIERFEDYSKTGYRFSLDKFKDKQLVSHLTARSITYDTATVHKWTVKDYMIREMDGMREVLSKEKKWTLSFFMEPADFLIMKNQQEMLTSPQLSEYINRQRQRGFANIKEFEIEYHKRIAMSFRFVYSDADWRVAFFEKDERRYGIAFRYRFGIKFLVHFVPNDCFYVCSEWQCTSFHRSVDTEFALCFHCILSV